MMGAQWTRLSPLRLIAILRSRRSFCVRLANEWTCMYGTWMKRFLLKSLLDGPFAGKASRTMRKLWKRWENVILVLCDVHSFYEELMGSGEAAALPMDQGMPWRPKRPLLRGQRWSRREECNAASIMNEMAIRRDRDPPP